MRRCGASLGFAEALVIGGGSRRLERIERLVDWPALEGLLSPIYAAATGRPAYPVLTMLKVMLLQQWYGLGDPAMEEALGDRLSFRRFAGLALDAAVPDHSTICRFRGELTRHGLADQVFDAVARQIEAQGLVLKSGTLIDATLVAAQAAPPPKQVGGGRSAADPDAAWAKRASGTAYFGYKLHVAVDLGSRIVRAARLTPANVNEIVVGPALVLGDEASVYADKSYVGPTMREAISRAGARDRVQHRRARGRGLTRWQTRRNVLIGRVRGRIEGVFGTLKRSFGLARMRYMGLARNTAATLLLLTAWNLDRAAQRAP
jgi:transposase, IS5 family